MRAGDLVRPKAHHIRRDWHVVAEGAFGVVIDFTVEGKPIVYWNMQYHEEIELKDQLEVIYE
jgi:hypothetical protein